MFLVRVLVLSLSFSMVVGAQSTAPTMSLTATSRAVWTPSADDQIMFDGIPIVSGYSGKVYLKTAVQGVMEPNTPPIITYDFGKPVPTMDSTVTPSIMVQMSGPLKSLTPSLQPNTEYIMFVHAVGLGTVSLPSGPTVPFGFPAVPRAVTSLRLTP